MADYLPWLGGEETELEAAVGAGAGVVGMRGEGAAQGGAFDAGGSEAVVAGGTGHLGVWRRTRRGKLWVAEETW
ncbi:hypothetical protein EX30DRAFT_343084 [Ascodesmis nigricans]|uniref:Uncharacterized protein n=1 Tax=Ascodesmis nigricans TaxID=341454 RepID=A0A4V6RHC4_9PEZI|nr:hypothetical protein EX30DRAFT_343084 [Ascodesmis nigricans]